MFLEGNIYALISVLELGILIVLRALTWALEK